MQKYIDNKEITYLKRESIPMHNFGDDSTWKDPTDSRFTMQPPPDEIWVVPAVRVRFSVNADFTSPLIVEYFIGEVNDPVKATIYKDNDDFIDRFDSVEILPLAGNGHYTSNIYKYEYQFDAPIILFGTNITSLNLLRKFSMRIENNEELKDYDGHVIEMVGVRYKGISIYKIGE